MKRFFVVAAAMICLSLGVGAASAQEPIPPRNLETNEGVVPPPGYAFLEGDMLVPISVLESRSAYDAVLWTNGIVYYQFASYISADNRELMRDAMDELESVAGVDFQPRSGQPNYIHVIEDDGNYSSVGMTGGKQTLSMYNWDYKYIIEHELIHALGFQHEQSRTDRDTYITINYGNIEAGMAYNFDIEASSVPVGDYDFCSVMHYDQYAFSIDYPDLKTIVPKAAYVGQAGCMGNRSYLTTLDKAGLAFRYPLPGDPGDIPQTAFSINSGVYIESIYTGDFTVSGGEPGFSCSENGAPVAHTVWYQITSAKERMIDILADGYDTVVAAYSGTPGDLFQEACVDGVGAGSTEWLQVPLKAGVAYYVGIGGWNGASGMLDLEIKSYRNVVRNGSFDWTSSVWKGASVPSTRVDDKLKCGYSGIYVSLCALAFKGGAGEASSFSQTIKPATLPGGWSFAAGHKLFLGYMVKTSSNKGNVSIMATITYAIGTKQKILVSATTGLTDGFVSRSAPGVLERSDVTKVVVKITNNSTGGKAWVDNVYLVGGLNFGLRDDLRNTPREKPETFAAPVGQHRKSASGAKPLPAPPALN